MTSPARPDSNLPRLRKLIQAESRNLWAQCRGALGDLREWDDKSILWFKAWLRFRVIDGVVRILGVVDPPPVPWREVYWQAEERLCPWDGNRLLTNLVALYLHCESPVPVRALLMHLLFHQAVQEEIKRRMDTRPFGRLWWKCLSESDPGKARMLLKHLTQDLKIRQGSSKMPLRSWYPLPNRTLDERISLGLEAVAELHATQRDRLAPLSVPAVPGTSSRLQGEAIPGWDAAAPALLEEDVQAIQDEWLPVLEGTMERGPLAMRDAYRREYEYETADMRNATEYCLDSLLEETDTDANPPEPARPQRDRLPPLGRRGPRSKTPEDHGHWPEQPTRRALLREIMALKDPVESRDRLRAVGQYFQKTFPPPVQRAIFHHRVDGQSQEEAAKMEDISVSKLRKALARLDKATPKLFR